MANSIITDIFDTALEATNRSKELGCNGYRKYTIDGAVKYVPCASASDYEKTLRYKESQGAVVGSGAQTNSDRLVGLQLAGNNTQSDALFTLGNFNISTSVSARNPSTFIQSDSTKTVTAETYSLSGIVEMNKRIEQAARATVNFDKTKFDRYVLYGSLKERIRYSMQEIIERFPAAITFTPKSVSNDVIREYSYIPFDNVSTFKLDLRNSRNPFTIITDTASSLDGLGDNVVELRDFTKEYTKYRLIYDGVDYEIIDAEFPDNNTDPFITLTTEGDPFSSVVNSNQNANVELTLKPKHEYITAFYDEVDDLTAYLLNVDNSVPYVSTFKDPVLHEGKLELRSVGLIFPTVDGYNPDLVSGKFDTFSDQLNKLADNQDNYKTNLILRFLTSDSLQEYDTEDRKIKIVLDSYGRMFDEVRKYINGITFMRNVSYDKINNVPDVMLKNFARMIGWESFNIQSDDSLAKSLFSTDTVERAEANVIAELDIELWRRLIINSAYLFKSKGTRKSLEFILKIIGIPEEVIEMDEYVYVARQKINYADYANALNDISVHPVDVNGYPTTPQLYFQAYGGNNDNNERNIGPYDQGKAYIDAYRKFDNLFAFDMDRTQDNQKSWVHSSATQSRNNIDDMNDTNYVVDHSNLVVNSKEMDIFIGSDRTHDAVIYRFFKRNNRKIDSTLSSGYTSVTDTPNITFNEFIRQVTIKYINVKNRKVIRNYPTLSKIYWDYLTLTKAAGSKQISIQKSLSFLNKFDTYWLKLIKQFVPATTILTAGKKIQNSIFNSSKHKYKQGRNDDVDWLGTDGSEFQNGAKQSVFNGGIKPVTPIAVAKGKYSVGVRPFSPSATANVNNSSELNRGNFGSVYHYSFYDYCAYNSNLLNIEHGYYGSMDDDSYDANINFNPDTSALISSSAYTEDYAYDGTSSLRVRLSDSIGGSFNLKLFELINISFSANTTYELSAKVMVIPWSGTTVPTTVSGGSINAFVDTGSTTGVITQASTYVEDLSKVTSGSWYSISLQFSSDENETSATVYFSFYDGVNNYTDFSGLDLFFDDIRLTVFNNEFDTAYNNLGIDYECPPPLPHVCYYDTASADGITSGYTYVLTENFTTLDNLEALPAVAAYSDMLHASSGATYNTSDGYVSLGLNAQPTYDNYYPISTSTTSAFTAGEYLRITFDVETLTTNGRALSSKRNGKILNYIPKFHLSLTEDDYVVVHPPTGGDQRVKYEFYYKVLKTETRAPRILFSVPKNANYYVNNIGNCEFRVHEFNILRIPSTTVDGVVYPVEQAYRYGFSLNSGSTLPSNYFVGGRTNYAVPYVASGATGTTVDGVFEAYEDRTLTDPLMHVRKDLTLYAKPTSEQESITIDLTDKLKLFNIFRTGVNGVIPNGEIGNQSYMSDALTLEFDGLYPTTNTLERTGVGPFYDLQDDFTLYGTMDADVTCPLGEGTIISVYNPFSELDDFDTSTTYVEFNRRSNNDGYIQINEYHQIKIEADLVFNSNYAGSQDVSVRLVNTGGTVYDESIVTFIGSDSIDNRIVKYEYTGFFKGSEEILIEIEPLDFPCVVKHYEDAIEDLPSTVSIFNGTSGQIGTMLIGATNVSIPTATGTTDITYSGTSWSDMFVINENYDQILVDIPVYNDISGNTYNILGYSGSTMILYPVNYGFSSSAFGSAQINGTAQIVTDEKKILVSNTPRNRSKIIEKNSSLTYTYPNNFVVGEYLYDVDPVWSSGELTVKGFGTVTTTNGSPTVAGLSTNFTNLIEVGDTVYIDGIGIKTVTGVTNDTSFAVSGSITTTVSGASYYKVLDSFDVESITRRRYSKFRVYKSDITGIKARLKNALLTFFNQDSVDTGLVKKTPIDCVPNALDNFFNATDRSQIEVFKYGSASFSRENDRVIMTYTLDKDLAGFNRTGEFIGRLSGKDVCGNSFSTYMIFVIDQDNSYTTVAEKFSRIDARFGTPITNDDSNNIVSTPTNDPFSIG